MTEQVLNLDHLSAEKTREIRIRVAQAMGDFYTQLVKEVAESPDPQSGETLADEVNDALDKLPPDFDRILTPLVTSVFSELNKNKKLIRMMEESAGCRIGDLALQIYLSVALNKKRAEIRKILNELGIKALSVQPLAGLVIISLSDEDKQKLRDKYGYTPDHRGVFSFDSKNSSFLSFIYVQDLKNKATISHEVHHAIWCFIQANIKPVVADVVGEPETASFDFQILKNEAIAYLLGTQLGPQPAELDLRPERLIFLKKKKQAVKEQTQPFKDSQLTVETLSLAWEWWKKQMPTAKVTDFIVPIARSTNYNDTYKNVGLLVLGKNPSPAVLDAYLSVRAPHSQRAEQTLWQAVQPDLMGSGVTDWLTRNLFPPHQEHAQTYLNRLVFLEALKHNFPQEFAIKLHHRAIALMRARPLVSFSSNLAVSG